MLDLFWYWKNLIETSGTDREGVKMKTLDLNEFMEMGLLQEINRRILHPIGLALSVIVDDDGVANFGGVLDSRDDPEGFCFRAAMLSDGEATWKRDNVDRLMDAKAATRVKSLGYHIQPVNQDSQRR